MPTPKKGYRDANDNIVVGVTTVLKQSDKGQLIAIANSLGLKGVKIYGPGGDWSHKADIGTATHALIQGHLDRRPVDFSGASQKAFEDAAPCFQSFLDWSADKILKGESELALVHPKLPYGGTMDFIGDDGVLMDWKSSSDQGFSQTDDLLAQLAAYVELALAHGRKVRRATVVQFPKTGAPAAELSIEVGSLQHKQAWELFRNLLEAYNLRRDLITWGKETR